MLLDLILAIGIVLAGECGPIRGNCEREVAKTMANRLVSTEFPDTLEGVLEAYYGRGEVTPKAMLAAIELVTAPSQLADGKYFYIYNDQDKYNMGYRVGDKSLCDKVFCVHFTEDWLGN